MPGVDLLKIVVIIVLVAVVLSLLAALVGLPIGAADGRDAWKYLNEPPRTTAGSVMPHGPMSIALEYMPDHLGIDVARIIRAGAAAAIFAVVGVLSVKLILRIAS